MKTIFFILTVCILLLAENQYTWSNVKLQGEIFVDLDGKPITGILTRTTRYPEVGIKVINRYENGLLNGISKMYHSNGKIKSEFNYENGLVVGEAKLYDKTGKLRVINYYKKDKKNGVSQIFNNSSTFYITYLNDFPIKGYSIDFKGNKTELTKNDLKNFY